ncbi:MAG: acyltransferase [Bacteroidales bacterium]|nr:acyltransferase [Bacteroidales bacterium]MCM1414566.1 acyltransferase [bacterium]MCM1422616.1 acyltransferase [bacterium]
MRSISVPVRKAGGNVVGRAGQDENGNMGVTDMGMAGRVIRSAVRSAYWKCCFGMGIEIPMVQGLDHVCLELARGGKAVFGERIQSRGHLSIQCGSEGKLEIGSHVFFNTGCNVACMGRIRIGDYCKIGNNTVIVDHDHNYKDDSGEYLAGDIWIGERVWIGANCTILKGARIGDDCVVAAGSVVNGEVPTGSLFYQKRENCVKSRYGDGSGAIGKGGSS